MRVDAKARDAAFRLFGVANDTDPSGAGGDIGSSFAPVWPTGPFVGQGLSGGLGSVVVRWGNDVSVDAVHVGPIDALQNLDDCQAMGEDSSPSGIPQMSSDSISVSSTRGRNL